MRNLASRLDVADGVGAAQGSLAPRRILAAVDGSPGSHLALRIATRMAQSTGASLTAIHVIAPEDPVAFDWPWVGLRTAERIRRAGEEILSEARGVAGDVLGAAELHAGSPGSVICRRAQELSVDLVILGGRHPHPTHPLLDTCVSAAVAATAPCSVLIVRGMSDAGGTEAPSGSQRR